MNNLTEEEIEKRLKSPENLANRLEIHKKNGNRSTTIPMEIRKTVAVLYNEDNGNQREIGEAFGIDSSSVGQSANSLVSSQSAIQTKENIELFEMNRKIKSKKDKVEDRAIDILMSQLDVIEGSEITSPTKALKIAKGMADIADKVRNRSADEVTPSKHLHIHIPSQKKLRDYEVIDAE